MGRLPLLASRVVAWVSLAFAAMSAHVLGGAQAKPNVIVVITDDQGYGDLSCHGNPVLRTPNLDKLHSESVRFTDFHSAPVCTPTRGQLLTGKDAIHNGAYAWAYSREAIHLDVKTMADVFRANGYATGHFGKWHLGDNYPYRPIDRGFDESIKMGGASVGQTPDYWNNDNYDDFYEHNGVVKAFKGFCDDIWFESAMEFARRAAAANKPFFIYLPTNLAHGPHIIDSSYSQKYVAALEAFKKQSGADFNLGLTASFFGMLDKFDENMGRLEEFLVDHKLKENTVIIFTTDNGGTGGVDVFNAGMREKKGSNFDGGHRVPCFIRWPQGGLGAPRDIAELTQMQDIFPTLVDFCKLECGESFDGMSLAKLLEGTQSALPQRMLVVQHATSPYPKKYQSTVMEGKWRLVEGDELYNVAEDPHQDQNVADKHPELVRALKAHYEGWWTKYYPRVEKEITIPLTQPDRPEVTLVCFDWRELQGRGNVTQQKTVREGVNVSGYWNVEVVEAGSYVIELMRWPKEADTAIAAASSPYQYRTGIYPAGKALPIKRAQLRVGDVEQQVDVGVSDRSASFTVSLAKGQYRLAGLFLDKEGKPLCGSFYAYVRRGEGN